MVVVVVVVVVVIVIVFRIYFILMFYFRLFTDVQQTKDCFRTSKKSAKAV